MMMMMMSMMMNDDDDDEEEEEYDDDDVGWYADSNPIRVKSSLIIIIIRYSITMKLSSAAVSVTLGTSKNKDARDID